MQRTVSYRLFLWFASLFDADAKVLALDPANENFVLEIEPGKVLRID